MRRDKLVCGLKYTVSCTCTFVYMGAQKLSLAYMYLFVSRMLAHGHTDLHTHTHTYTQFGPSRHLSQNLYPGERDRAFLPGIHEK